jgi:hypothetical protein
MADPSEPPDKERWRDKHSSEIPDKERWWDRHPSEFPEEDRWWEKHKIVVWWKHDGEIGDEFACGDTPEEVVDFMRSRSWIEEENKDSQKYMSGVQSRTLGPVDFLFHDAESFLFGLMKIDSLHLQKWEWDPEYDSNSK